MGLFRKPPPLRALDQWHYRSHFTMYGSPPDQQFTVRHEGNELLAEVAPAALLDHHFCTLADPGAARGAQAALWRARWRDQFPGASLESPFAGVRLVTDPPGQRPAYHATVTTMLQDPYVTLGAIVELTPPHRAQSAATTWNLFGASFNAMLTETEQKPQVRRLALQHLATTFELLLERMPGPDDAGRAAYDAMATITPNSRANAADGGAPAPDRRRHQAATDARTLPGQLAQLNALHAASVLTDEEFAAAKRQLLGTA